MNFRADDISVGKKPRGTEMNDTRSCLAHLPRATSDLMRACTVVPWFHSFVEELVLNSLDAGSTKIVVRVNFANYCVEVHDDGKAPMQVKKKKIMCCGRRYGHQPV
jgi:hypothetical protein